jgi:HPt (histidine-containing phosphotransfer) domain-containing protein
VLPSDTPTLLLPKLSAEARTVLTAVLTWVDGEIEFLATVLPTFLTEAPELIRELREALDANDLYTVQRLGHGLKGTLCNFGIPDLRDTAAAIEACGAAGDLGDVPQLLTRLEAGLQHLCAIVTEILDAVQAFQGASMSLEGSPENSPMGRESSRRL